MKLTLSGNETNTGLGMRLTLNGNETNTEWE